MLTDRQCMIGETAWFRKLEDEYHYMGESHGAGDVVRLVFEEDGAPVALMTWAAVCYCLKWRMACRKAAEEHVLTQSALAASSKELWRRVSSEGMSVKDAAKALGIPANTASKVKRRIETMVAAARDDGRRRNAVPTVFARPATAAETAALHTRYAHACLPHTSGFGILCVMERYFNVAGPCIPGEHYMLPALDRLPQARRLVSQRQWLVITKV